MPLPEEGLNRGRGLLGELLAGYGSVLKGRSRSIKVTWYLKQNLKQGPKSPVGDRYAAQTTPMGAQQPVPVAGSRQRCGDPPEQLGGPWAYLISAVWPLGARGAGVAPRPTTWSCGG